MFEMAFLQRKEFRYVQPRLSHHLTENSVSYLTHVIYIHASAHLPSHCVHLHSVLHEPLGEPFYYSRERMSKRFSRESRPEDFSKYADLTFGKVRSASEPKMHNGLSSHSISLMLHLSTLV